MFVLKCKIAILREVRISWSSVTLYAKHSTDGHISSDSNILDNDTAGNAELNKLWQVTLASPDKPSLLYGHSTTPLKVLMTGQGQVVTE